MAVDLLNPQTALGQTPSGLLYPLQVTEAGFARAAPAIGDYASFNPILGFKITKVENINTATGVDLVAVTGKVLITAWSGEVTNAFDGAAPADYKLRIKTDNVDLCAATDLHGAVIGYMWSLSGDAGLTLLTGSSYAVSAVKTADMNGLGFANRFVGLAGGSCTIQSLRTAGNSGDSMTHSLWYWPLEASAAIVAL